MDGCLQAEINWINNNLDRYDCHMHAQAVIGNITKRYHITELNKRIQLLNEYIESLTGKEQHND